MYSSFNSGFLSKAARGYLLAAGKTPELPSYTGDSLAGRLTALQQAEACYRRTQSVAALSAAQALLQQLSDTLLQQQQAAAAEVALALARQLMQQPEVFDLPDYNLLLLHLTQQLFVAGATSHAS